MLEACVTQKVARSGVVTGPDGIGKSRLAAEIERVASELGASVWKGRADANGRSEPFGVLGDVLRNLAEIDPGEPLAARRVKLRERLGKHLDPDSLWETAAVLGEAMGTSFFDGGPDEGERGGGGSVLLADLAMRAWEELLVAELAGGPVVLLIDDAHAADPPSLRLFDAALRNLSSQPFAVVAFGRHELTTLFPALFVAHADVAVGLSALTEAHARELLGALASDRIEPGEIAALAAGSGGNPFVLEGLAQDARSTGAPRTAPGIAAPRIAAASAETRWVLRAASVLGEVFARGDLVALLDGAVDEEALDPAIEEACVRDLLERRKGGDPGDPQLAFRSPVVREAAYGMLAEEDRARAHRLAAHRLADEERDPAILAWHFERGGAPELAVERYKVAALRALAANDFEAAIARSKRAEACGATGTTLGEVSRIAADAHLWRGETEAAAKEARRAIELLQPGTVAWFQAAAAYAVAASRLGNTDALHAAASDLESLIAGRPSSQVEPALRVAQVTSMARIAIALVFAGDLESAEPLLGRMHALRVAGALDALPFALGHAHRAHAVRAHVRDELLAAFLAFEAAAGSFERAGALRDACVDRANAGFMKTELGQNEEAEALQSAALAQATRLGLPTVTANAQLNLCLLLTRRGAAFPAAAMGETALATFEKQGSARMITVALVYLSRALLIGGAAPMAQKRAKRAADLADDVLPYRAYAYAALSFTELAMGRLDEAVAAAETGLASLRDCGAEEGAAFVRLAYVEALDAADRVSEARDALYEADNELLFRAAKITDPGHRQAFLRNIPEHARTVELAESMGVGASSRAPTMIARG